MRIFASALRRIALSGLVLVLPFLFLVAMGKQEEEAASGGHYWTESTGVSQGGVPAADGANLQEAFTRLAETVRPAVVNVSTVYVEKGEEQQPYEFYFGSPFEDFFNDFFGEEGAPRQQQERSQPWQRKVEGTGSGVIISAEGYILTNEHVIRNAEKINIILANAEGKETRYTGKVIGRDPRTDLAVVKIEPKGQLPFVTLGDSDDIRVGEWVAAIGSPFGLQQTVTSGIVSAVRQSLSIEGNSYRDLIQTDAAINRGNSGGPLCNMRGEIIGINTAIYAPTGVFSGVGFAVPINSAKAVLDEMIEKGKVVRGWLGVEIRPVDQVIANQFNLPDTQGVLINDVVQGSPAARAGLKRGDVIREFAGKTVSNSRQLQEIVSGTPPRTRVNVKIIRDGKEVTLPLVTEEMPAAEEELGALPQGEGELEPQSSEVEGVRGSDAWAGMEVAGLSRTLVERYGITGRDKGVLVLIINPGSPADDMGLEPGDLIIAINRVETAGVREFRSAARKADLSKGIVLDIVRQGRPSYVTYEPQR